MWLFFIIPGLIYSVWRQSSYHKACPVCGGTNLIPIDSPVGQKLLKEQGKTVEQITTENATIGGEKRKKIFMVAGGFIGLVIVCRIIVLIATGS